MKNKKHGMIIKNEYHGGYYESFKICNSWFAG